METIRVYSKDEPEHKTLEQFCDFMNRETPDRFEFSLEDIYFDAGQDWKYTAVITTDRLSYDNTKGKFLSGNSAWQTLNPRDYEKIILATNKSTDEREECFESISKELLKGTLYECEEKTIEMAIVFTSDDTLKVVPYNGYDTLSNGVGGMIERVGSVSIPVSPMKEIECDVYCNEEGLLIDREDLNKINPFASSINGSPVYGNVVIVPQINNGEDNRGFKSHYVDGEQDICECWFAEDYLLLLINHNKEMFSELHKEWDNNKPEPFCIVEPFENDDYTEERD